MPPSRSIANGSPCVCLMCARTCSGQESMSESTTFSTPDSLPGAGDIVAHTPVALSRSLNSSRSCIISLYECEAVEPSSSSGETSTHQHSHGRPMQAGPHSHNAAASNQRRLLVVLCLTTAYLIAEVIGGLLTGSLALLADAGHMLADVF